MAQANGEWRVGGSGPIEKLEPGLWRVQGDVPGMPLKRVMTLAKLQDGRVLVHNAIALSEEHMGEIDQWGEIAYLVVPNGMHRLDAAAFKKRYPSAKVIAPSGSRKKIEQLVAVDLNSDEFPPDAHVSFELLEGTRAVELVMVVKTDEGTTVVFTDGLFNMPHIGGFQGFLLKHVLKSSGGPRVSRLGRLMLIKDQQAYVSHFRRLADLPNLKRIIVAHHEVITSNPAGVLRDVASSLG